MTTPSDPGQPEKPERPALEPVPPAWPPPGGLKQSRWPKVIVYAFDAIMLTAIVIAIVMTIVSFVAR